MSYFGALIILILVPLSISIPNCIKEFQNECLMCQNGFVLENKSCIRCFDQNCKTCFNSNINFCNDCNIGFVLANKQCGLSCDSILNCNTCSSDLKQCIECKRSCKLSEGKCTCTSMLIQIIVCVVISLIVVIIVAFCLTFTLTSRKNKLVQFALNVTTNEMDIIQGVENRRIIIDQEDINYHSKSAKTKKKKKKIETNSHEPQQLTIISTETNVPKSLTGEDKSLCEYCYVETSIEKLSCGCNLCSRHHTLFKNNTGNNKCPVCQKEVTNIDVLRCGICTKINTEFNQLHCQCELSVCNDCYKKKENKETKEITCPNCIKS